MATKELVTKVWIEPGCIVCDACETTSPDVFDVTEDTCLIRPDALNPDFTKPRTQEIVDAAEECPVDVIKFETVTAEVSDEEAAAAAAPPAAKAKEAAGAKEEAAKGGGAKAAGAKDADTNAGAKGPVKATADGKSPDTKAPKKTAASEKTDPAKVPVSASAETSMAAQGDPAIQALLEAATSRGGTAVMLRKSASAPDQIQELKRKDPRELPPDARQAKVMEAAQRSAKQQPNKGRRAVVGGAALGLGWLAFGAGSILAGGPAFLRFMVPNVLEEPDPRVRIGKLQRYLEMQVGDVNEDYKPQGIWIIRTEKGVAALSIICTHLGCIPNWLPNDRKFKCPCHGSGYYYTGINFEGPTPRPLERFKIYADGDQLIVDKSKKYQYELGQWGFPGSIIEV